MSDTINIVISSGFISLIVTALTMLFFSGAYKEKINSLEKSVAKYDTSIAEMRDRISRMEGGIDRDRAHNPFIKSQSPLSLTDIGKVALYESTGKNYVDANKSTLINQIKSKNPKTAYDVQEAARLVIDECSNSDAFIPIKDYVYYKGENLKNIIDVLGIYLRDIALPILGFDISQIKD